MAHRPPRKSRTARRAACRACIPWKRGGRITGETSARRRRMAGLCGI
jgi:hypothetical protein